MNKPLLKGEFGAYFQKGTNGHALLIIPGSGPIDRDGNTSFLKGNSLKYLGDSLQSKGYTVLRTDKLSAGNFPSSLMPTVTYEWYVQLANEWLNVLVDSGYSKVSILGHSQGALTAFILGNRRPEITSVVSICGAGQSIDNILKLQLAAQFPPEQMQAIEEAIDEIARGGSPESPNPMLESMFTPAMFPFLKSWMDYDPCELISTLECPVLLISGQNDIQVSSSESARLARCNPNAISIEIQGMGHMLKLAPKSRLLANNYYGHPEIPVVADLPIQIDNFLTSH